MKLCYTQHNLSERFCKDLKLANMLEVWRLFSSINVMWRPFLPGNLLVAGLAVTNPAFSSFE